MELKIIFCCLLSLTSIACSGLKPNVGYVCKTCEENHVTLDGDTFWLQETITPDLLIVCDYPEWGRHSYLIQKAHTGYFYLKMESDEITSIGNTEYLVSVNGNEVYNVETETQYSLPYSTTCLTYLDEWEGLQAFTTGDTIYYSDGKYVALKEYCYCQPGETELSITLRNGARKITVTLGDVYDYEGGGATAPIATKRLEKDFYIKSQNESESEGLGFSVDLDVPEGETMADVAIREWMVDAIKNDVFSLLGYQKGFKARKRPSYDEFVNALDDFGMFWEKLCRNDYQIEETYGIRLNCDISTRLIVDTPDYVTYHYMASIDEGDIHGKPRSYYITYDKKRQTLLSAANTVKASGFVQFRKEVIQVLKERNDDIYGKKSTMEDFMQLAFSFHVPIFGEDIDEAWIPFLVHEYECDKWSGWENSIKKEFTLDNFPLPHFALLPEGIVVTYHPYQIDCFDAGEYHAIVPYSKANPCLLHSYCEDASRFPKLCDFIVLK